MVVSDWEVVGIARFPSKKNPSNEFFAISCIRNNDSLYSGVTECCRKVVSVKAVDAGLDVGSHVFFYGSQNGSDFVAFVKCIE